MHPRISHIRWTLPTAILLALTATPAEAPSCGPIFPEAVFSFEKTPPDFTGYSNGRLGVHRPTFWRRYQVIAYRYLSDSPLTRDEIKGPEGSGRPSQDIWAAMETWRKSRGAVVKQTAPPIATYRAHKKYSGYDNCLPDAFVNASRTLDERVKTFGAAHAGVKAWVDAQDAVFANCSQGRTIPAEPDAALPAVLRADREYQIAAAHFYSEGFQEAYQRFRKIAADRGSQWSTIAPYLAARCLIRETTLSDGGKFAQALGELETIAADSRLSAYRQPTDDMRAYVAMRLRPQEVIDRVSADLRKPSNGEKFRQNLVDFDYVWERANVVPRDDMGAWISWMASQKHDDAVARWRASKSVPWLVAALESATAKDKSVPDLLAAAESTPESSPAYASALYHRLRLIEEQGKRAEVRAELDRKAPVIQRLPLSAFNLFVAQRMRLAQSLDEFLRFAPRKPVAVAFENESSSSEPTKIGDKVIPDAMLDIDSMRIFNSGLPFASLRTAALSRTLPAAVSTRLLLTAFTRAVILGRDDAANELGAALAERRPALRPLVDRYRAAKDPAERKFAAAYLLLRSPGLRTQLEGSLSSRDEENLQEIDDFRQNWWCKADPKAQPMPPPFLTAAERKDFDAEWTKMQALEAGPTWLGRQAVEWAKAHPEDPRSPEALHLAVRATRYGCTDDGNSAVSKAAFTALHARWPKSEWAAKTPYWF
ncbi:MAG: hypothetical protein U0Q16_09925 [Bryobacteraceae bacterium]